MSDRGFVQGFNGVSYGSIIDVVAQDDTDGFIEGRIKNEGFAQYPIAFIVQVTDGSNVVVDLADAVLKFNSDVTGGGNGYFRIEDGAVTFALTAGQKIHILASNARLI